jgi:hypothetical protein
MCNGGRLAEWMGERASARACLSAWCTCVFPKQALASEAYARNVRRLKAEIVMKWHGAAVAAVAARTAEAMRLEALAVGQARCRLLGRACASWKEATAAAREERARSQFRKQLCVTAAATLAGMRGHGHGLPLVGPRPARRLHATATGEGQKGLP